MPVRHPDACTINGKTNAASMEVCIPRVLLHARDYGLWTCRWKGGHFIVHILQLPPHTVHTCQLSISDNGSVGTHAISRKLILQSYSCGSMQAHLAQGQCPILGSKNFCEAISSLSQRWMELCSDHLITFKDF